MRNDSPEFLRTARWVTLAVAVLILWGSLYPFDFLWPDADLLVYRLAHAASYFISRVDSIANVLLYVPLGAMLQFVSGRADSPRRVPVSTLYGSVFSLSMELLQLTTPHRVTSVLDWTLNTCGSLIGASAVMLYLAVGERWRFTGMLGRRPALVPLSLLALWLVTLMIPSGPSRGTLLLGKAAAAGYLPTPLSLTGWCVALATWWVLAECTRHILRPAWAVGMLAALVLLSLFARSLTGLRPPNGLDIGSAALVFVVAALATRWTGRSRAGLTAALCIVALLLEGSAPLAAGGKVGSFHWIPFSGSLLTTRDYGPLLHHLFLNGALLWSLAMALGALSWALALTFGLTLGIELAQMWMPHRRAEITDPLLVAALAGAFALARRFQRDAFGAGAFASARAAATNEFP